MTRALRLILVLPLLIAVVACAPALELDNPQQPVVTDPGVLSGQLENGFRYYLRSANSAPENDRLELRLVVKAGSLNEGPDQRGYAHLVEHMAYRGTASFSTEKIESLLSDNGLRWGVDINALTHYGATVYRFSLHQSDDHLLPEILSLMADWLDSIEFEPSALVKEKRIVEAELRERYAERNYVVDPVTVSAYAGSRYENRQPAGDLFGYQTATAEGLRKFWESYYRPDNAALIITGGARPWQFESMIASVFSRLNSRPERTVATELVNTSELHSSGAGVKVFKDGTLVELLSSSDPTQPLPGLSVNLISKLSELPSGIDDSVAAVKKRFRNQLMFSAYTYLVRDRIVNTPECSAVKLSASLLESGQAVEHLNLTLTEKAMLPCLSVAFDAVRTVQEYQLTVEEFAEFASLFERIAQVNVDQHRSRNADVLASGIVDMVANGEVVFSAWDMQRILNEVVSDLDVDALNNMIKNITESHRLVFSAVSNTHQRPSLEGMISAINNNVQESGRVHSTVVHGVLRSDQSKLAESDLKHSSELMHSIASLLPEEQLIRSMSDLPFIVKVSSQGNYHEWRLENGATVILLKDTEYDQVAVTAISDGGYARRSGVEAIAGESLPEYLSVNGVNGYTNRSLRNIMTSRKIFVKPFVDPFNHGIAASGTAQELPAMIAMIRGYFAEPLLIEPQSSIFLEHLKASKAESDWPGSVWHGISDGLDKNSLKNELFIKTHRELFGSTSKFGFVFVGLLEPEQLEQELYRLNVNAETKPMRSGEITADTNKLLLKQGNKTTDMSLVLSCSSVPELSFSGDSGSGILPLWHWQLLADILSERLRYELREEHGFVYDIENDIPASKQLLLELGFSVLPENGVVVQSAVSDVLSQLSANGATQKELDGAIARKRRNKKHGTAGYESVAREKAQQWIYSGKTQLEDSFPADIDYLNQLAQCLSDPLQLIELDSSNSFSVGDPALLSDPRTQ